MKPGIDYIGVGTGAVIVNEEGKILLTRRGPKARNQVGKWEAPGGRVEFGETAKQTIIREIKEELDIDIRVNFLLGFVDDIIEEEKQHWVGTTWLASIVNGEPKIMEKENCDGLGWFSVEEANDLPKSLTLQHDLEAYKNYLKTQKSPNIAPQEYFYPKSTLSSFAKGAHFIFLAVIKNQVIPDSQLTIK